MSENEKKSILDSRLDEEQLKKTAGGDGGGASFSWYDCEKNAEGENDPIHCKAEWYWMDTGCARSVRSDDTCDKGDSCSYNAVIYNDSCFSHAYQRHYGLR